MYTNPQSIGLDSDSAGGSPPWDRSVGFEMNASGAAIPRSSCVLNADGKPVLPASKPGAFTKWPCRRHGKALFNSIVLSH